MPNQHYPTILHLECLNCGARVYSLKYNNHLPKEVTKEELLAVLREPAEDREC